MQYGPKISTNGLVATFDAADRNSYLKNSLINMNNWTVSTGPVTGYPINGSSSENQRISATGPWGVADVVWGTYPLGDTGADGGWNTDSFNVDNTKMYRFSVWVRRTSSTTSGSYYLGLFANGAGPVQMSDNVINNNSYWFCNNIGELTQNTWYLLVGHVYPFNTTYTGKHPDTGFYLVNNPVKTSVGYIGCNIGSGDVKWSSDTTTAQHRAYHYYCADNTSRIQFYDPRVDLINGTEPSIYELVSRPPNIWKSIIDNSINGILTNKPIFDTSNYGIFIFNGSTNLSLATPTPTVLRGNPDLTILGYYKRTASFSGKGFWGIGGSNAGGTAGGINNYNYNNTNEIAVDSWGQSTFTTGQTYPLNTWIGVAWRKYAGPMTRANCILSIFNGTTITHYTSTNLTVLRAEAATNLAINSFGGVTLGSISIDTGYCSPVNIANHSIYNRVLTDVEILQYFQTIKSRFGL